MEINEHSAWATRCPNGLFGGAVGHARYGRAQSSLRNNSTGRHDGYAGDAKHHDEYEMTNRADKKQNLNTYRQ